MLIKKSIIDNLKYHLFYGKNSKLKYYTLSYLHLAVPSWILRRRLAYLLRSIERRADRDDIVKRAEYYCHFDTLSDEAHSEFLQSAVEIGKQPIVHSTVYYLDSMRYARHFPKHFKWILKHGDNTIDPKNPSIVKSRTINDEQKSSNAVVMKLDKVRHFLFVRDKKSFAEKQNKVLFRGAVGQLDSSGSLKSKRVKFLKMWHNHPMCDLAAVDKHLTEWRGAKLTIREHLNYKFIMALEGNDVASNLKWIMSSNSLAVMPRPTYETWFMEGKLIPNYHYVEIKPDFTDLIERIQYYIDNPDEAEAIVRHAHEWVAQFRDRKREKLISLLTLNNYFEKTHNR